MKNKTDYKKQDYLKAVLDELVNIGGHAGKIEWETATHFYYTNKPIAQASVILKKIQEEKLNNNL